MDPISGINEILKLLGPKGRQTERVSSKDSKGKSEKLNKTISLDRSASEGMLRKIHAQIDKLELCDQTLEKKAEIFLSTVLTWKLGEQLGGLDAQKASAQVQELIFSDPKLKSKMVELLKRF